MIRQSEHTFHIPVMGLGYTIDTPLKVARFGIASVVSIIEDNLLEQMRMYYCNQIGEEYIPITTENLNFRALRVTAYLNLLNQIVQKQFETLQSGEFNPGSELTRYFELLPDQSPLKLRYTEMLRMNDGFEKTVVQDQLREDITPGSIDVNIMTKIDRVIYTKDGDVLPPEYSDAMAALRGFAKSTLQSSVVLSAGLNPRLYSYIENFKDFFPDQEGNLKKKIILKVSDYRSALIQGKFLAKKGIWVSEFRIESGLNCGGHAFATEGLLLGPIMEEFKSKRQELSNELLSMCNTALLAKGMNLLNDPSTLRISVQGGIGTAREDQFLREYYKADHTGWGSPFLLVPEVTNVDEHTLNLLVNANKEDYFLSHASPLGVPFNNFRRSTSEDQRKERIDKGKPGSPCYKEFLSTNTEFTERPICTSSRQYQRLKIKELQAKGLSPEELHQEMKLIVEKDCLCEGLGNSVLIKDEIPHPKRLKAVAICPGPNLAYFSRIATLDEMVGHIYGRLNLLNNLLRPNMFVNELNLYIDYFKNEVNKLKNSLNDKKAKQLDTFKSNLLNGIAYYKELVDKLASESETYKASMRDDLQEVESMLSRMLMPETYGEKACERI